MRNRILGLAIALSLLTPALGAAQGHSDVVARVKSSLIVRNVPLDGACGAFQITGRVAFELKDQGYKLLKKAAGNRAIIQSDGSCLDDQHGSGPGYATDYLIASQEGFGGYDLLSDGGGANGPQWNGPENDADTVNRNLRNFAEPFAMDAVTPAPVPVPMPVPTPTPVPAPAPPSGDISSLLQQVIDLQREQIDWLRGINTTTLQTNEHVTNMDRTLTQTLGNFSKFVGKYIAPAIAGWVIAHNTGGN